MHLLVQWDPWFLAIRCCRFDPFDRFGRKNPKPLEDQLDPLNQWFLFCLYYRFGPVGLAHQSRWNRWDLFDPWCRFALVVLETQHLQDLCRRLNRLGP